jgi:hypothetical protein
MRIASTTLNKEAVDALESLRQLGFRITSHTGAHRLIRQDGSQAQLYRLDGRLDVNGYLGLISEVSLDQAAIKGLAVARAILQEESDRLKLPRWIPPSIDSKPYG